MHVVHPHEVVDHLSEGPIRLLGLEVTDVLGDEHVASDRHGDRVLEVRSDGQDRRHRCREGDGERCVSAGPTEHADVVVDRPDDRVVDVAADRTIVSEEHVGDGAEPLGRVGVIDADRFVGPDSPTWRRPGR